VTDQLWGDGIALDQNCWLSVATGLHKGDRDRQEDQVAVFAHPRVNGCVMGVVADGMGGRTGGRKASNQVILTAQQLFDQYMPGVSDTTVLLHQVVKQAHTVIRLMAIVAEQEPHSTIAAFIINPNGACFWVHSGDSRIYHFRGSTLVKRTRDHSFVQLLVDRGQLTEAEAAVHPQSNVLMSCLGMDREPEMNMHCIPRLQPGDTLLACSDGLWHFFDTDALGMVVSTLPPRAASQVLVRQARQRAMGGGDNLGLIIARVDSLLPPSP
jgi:serine/threonine protein phosphatase PrpC